jgi:hypothetical protein
VHFYNQRAEDSENRIKELKNDFSAKQMPCADFNANALYFDICSLSFFRRIASDNHLSNLTFVICGDVVYKITGDINTSWLFYDFVSILLAYVAYLNAVV